MPANSVSPAADIKLEAQRQRTASLRTCLLFGSATAVAAALVLATPTAVLVADPELARLLRGMAAVKSVIAAVAIGLIHWRFGRSLSSRQAGTYLAGVWMIAGASTMIWQLAQIPTAAFAFHLGAFMLLATACRDRSN